MIPIPWKYVRTWNCITCGSCCKGYQVVLTFPEWIQIIRKFGVEVTQPGVSRLYLKRKSNGTCSFSYTAWNRRLCGLQKMKPKACKLWPFKISTRPKYGRPNDAFYKYGASPLYIYVDPACRGIKWGNPDPSFKKNTLKELIEIALGFRTEQHFSTSRTPSFPFHL